MRRDSSSHSKQNSTCECNIDYGKTKTTTLAESPVYSVQTDRLIEKERKEKKEDTSTF